MRPKKFVIEIDASGLTLIDAEKILRSEGSNEMLSHLVGMDYRRWLVCDT